MIYIKNQCRVATGRKIPVVNAANDGYKPVKNSCIPLFVNHFVRKNRKDTPQQRVGNSRRVIP